MSVLFFGPEKLSANIRKGQGNDKGKVSRFSPRFGFKETSPGPRIRLTQTKTVPEGLCCLRPIP